MSFMSPGIALIRVSYNSLYGEYNSFGDFMIPKSRQSCHIINFRFSSGLILKKFFPLVLQAITPADCSFKKTVISRLEQSDAQMNVGQATNNTPCFFVFFLVTTRVYCTGNGPYWNSVKTNARRRITQK